MANERLIGIDFGTSTSVIRVKRYQDGLPLGDKLTTMAVTFDMGRTMTPTLVRKIEGGSYYGVEATRAMKHSTLYQNFKMDLESSDAEIRQQAMLLTEEFFRYLAEQYMEQKVSGHLGDSDDEEHTYISYPVKWKDETKQFLMEAARKAGFHSVIGMDEVQAAIQAAVVQNVEQLLNKNILCKNEPVNVLLIDMGAGTTDLALCRCVPGDRIESKFLCTWPKGGDICFGGREMDALLMNYIREKLPVDQADGVLARCGMEKFKAWKEEMVSPTLAKQGVVEEFSEIDQLAEFMDIEMPAYRLDRKALETLAADYLRQFPELIDGCLNEAGLSASQIHMVILTGGHSQWYFVSEMLKAKLPLAEEEPARIVSLALPQETVAVGLVYSGFKKPLDKHLVYCPAVKATCTAEGSREYWRDTETNEIFEDADGMKKIPVTARQKLIIPKTEHSYSWVVENGGRYLKCVSCGKIKQTEIPKPVEPEIRKEPVLPRETDETLFEFKSHKDNYLILKYKGTLANVVIPDTYRGRPVIGILPEAFKKTGVGSVRVPKAITRIPKNCFEECSRLKQVILHDGICEIDCFAFAQCENLQIVDFGIDSCEPGIIHFPKTLRYIGSGAFDGNSRGKHMPYIKEIMCSRRTNIADLRQVEARFYYPDEPENLEPDEDAKIYAHGSTPEAEKLQTKAADYKKISVYFGVIPAVIGVIIGFISSVKEQGTLTALGITLMVLGYGVWLYVSFKKCYAFLAKARAEIVDYFTNRCYEANRDK